MTLVLMLLALVLLTLLGLVAYTWRWKVRIERLVPPRGKFTTISSGRLHYVDVGTGPAVLLIHGLGGQLGNFDCGLIEDLSRDYRVIAVDRPGMGYSQRPPDAPVSLPDHAALMFEMIAALKLDRPLVVGHSLGGAIALTMAVQDPVKLRGLALLAPMSLRVKTPASAFNNLKIQNAALRWLVAWTLATPGALRNHGPILHQIYGPERMPATAPIRGGGLLGLRPVHFFNTSRDYLTSTRGLNATMAGYADMTLPVAVLFGSEDRTLDPTLHGVTLNRDHPHMALTLISGGHMLPVTQPQTCADFIRANDPARDAA